ncbi:hypothetical protein UA08_06058 [Talaromyces atroroseus]|uniref:NmrA-like domain-containing protein n=1 Tax=Talaromyces atroroseus TaxID=1441469 RepID=A0A225ABY9_TALAT|nr:hypothetical protein UA08_06058 [Talaromyces atroroseus]OKL58562.1 hypothetical protein UA08_06058 [Talaromyces atroroseus]
MTQQYAAQQLQGFNNRIDTVAIIGAGGQIGRFFTKHILKTGKHVVTAITRPGTSHAFPGGVKAAAIDYNDEDSLVSALTGQDFLIITLSLAAPPDTHSRLVKAAAKAGVPYIMPNAYSINFYDNEILQRDIPVGQTVLERIAEVKQLGINCIPAMVGFWYEYSLAMGEDTFGFKWASRQVTFYDEGKKSINCSTWDQCGRAVAALLSLKRLPDDEDDKSVTLSRFQDRPLFVSSFTVSQKDMLESVKRVTGATEGEWKVSYQPSNTRYKEGLEELYRGKQTGFYKAMYARVFYPSGDADFGPDNMLLGLPEEDLDEATRRAIEISEEF